MIYRQTPEGYLDRETHLNPTPETRAEAKAQRKAMISQMGRRAVNNLQPAAETTVERFTARW
ncbi:MAG: hypothetical protein H7244_08605 [Herminiimonas sp.]|nr:hypothetical protein [Herminiimonas sp.]